MPSPVVRHCHCAKAVVSMTAVRALRTRLGGPHGDVEAWESPATDEISSSRREVGCVRTPAGSGPDGLRLSPRASSVIGVGRSGTSATTGLVGEARPLASSAAGRSRSGPSSSNEQGHWESKTLVRVRLRGCSARSGAVRMRHLRPWPVGRRRKDYQVAKSSGRELVVGDLHAATPMALKDPRMCSHIALLARGVAGGARGGDPGHSETRFRSARARRGPRSRSHDHGSGDLGPLPALSRRLGLEGLPTLVRGVRLDVRESRPNVCRGRGSSCGNSASPVRPEAERSRV